MDLDDAAVGDAVDSGAPAGAAAEVAGPSAVAAATDSSAPPSFDADGDVVIGDGSGGGTLSEGVAAAAGRAVEIAAAEEQGRRGIKRLRISEDADADDA